ncbi:MAG TPA: glutamine synthetase family protein [Dongiaceae bacterium]|jgi:glutamine synthetase|nr:glutamine synthetase family protein [Dongiaceae bacterium]
MAEGDIIYLAWNDLVGLTRVRGVPAADIGRRMEYGLGWAVAGQALTPFEHIAPNPWGPMLEVRQTPVAETETRVDIWPDAAALHFFLCDSKMPDGSNWECCTRSFMTKALAALKAETGLQFVGAFEHEFLLSGGEKNWCVPFSLEQVRINAEFLRDTTRALLAAKVGVETVEPEYGVLQYEVSCAPALGAMAGDRAIVAREVIREAARRLGLRASFTPKPQPDQVGNGAHLHFSFRDEGTRNAAFDPDVPTNISAVAQHFIGGVVRHMPALCALMAPSPVSYLRLGPSHWSCGYNAFGIQNREASIRVCPSPERDPAKRARAFNLEIRIPDATASPYMVIGALVNAGLAGIREKLPLPPVVDRDPGELTEEERKRLDIVALPSTLAEALDVLEADELVKSWMSPNMYLTYTAVKRIEAAMFADQDPRYMCQRYHDAY